MDVHRMSRRLSIGDYHVGPYCGERFWRLRSWTSYIKQFGLFRKTTGGFSIGPILFWKEKIK